MEQKGKEAVEVEGWVKVRGRLDREEMERVVEKVLETGKMADKVILVGRGTPCLGMGVVRKEGSVMRGQTKLRETCKGK